MCNNCDIIQRTFESMDEFLGFVEGRTWEIVDCSNKCYIGRQARLSGKYTNPYLFSNFFSVSGVSSYLYQSVALKNTYLMPDNSILIEKDDNVEYYGYHYGMALKEVK